MQSLKFMIQFVRMKLFFRLILLFILAGLTTNTVPAETLDGYAQDLLENPQANEITLQTPDNTIFEMENKTEFIIETPDQTNDIDSDDKIINNNELDRELFKMFDKDNDNVIDEDTILGKVLHSKITRTDIPSYLYKDDLTFKFKESSPVQKVQVYGIYRGSLGALFNKGNYSTEYENLTTQIGVLGSLKNPDYRFKFSVSPIQSSGNYFDQFITNAYIMNTSIPNHQIIAGYSRPQIGLEGGTTTQIIPFVARSQIARNFGNVRSLSVKVIGNYQYVDYNFSAGSSGRYITSGMPGTEFNGWVNFKPLGKKEKKYGQVTFGGGFNGGHNRIDYSVGSLHVGYHHKKLWANFETAIADGYNGSKGVSANKACGYAATVGWKFNPHWQLIGRIDQFDPNRDTSNDLKREYTAGINWFIKGQALKLILNYVFCQNQNADDSHKIILATQILL